MAITKQKKKEIYEKLTTLVRENIGVVFVNFHKLTVADATKMRRGLRAEGVGFYVAKKTLIRKALTDAKIQGEMPTLDGEVGVAYATDSIAPARGVYTFQKSLDKAVQIIGGVFEGSFKTKDEMVVIASIPGRQTLLAQFVQLINSPRQRFAVVLSEKAKKNSVA